MTAPVAVVDYGAGNMLSVCRAFAHFGVEPELANDAESVLRADRLVLPGVGAFGACMAALMGAGLVDAVKAYIMDQRPFMGICVGMQMLFDTSHEFGRCEGLGMIPGDVIAIDGLSKTGHRRKRPLVGWQKLEQQNQSWSDSHLKSCAEGSEVYFVHSFAVQPRNENDVLATYTHHEGDRFVAAVRRGNVYGFQFHPEKSGPVGLSIIEAFLD